MNSQRIQATWRTYKRLNGPESELVPITIGGHYEPDSDTFYYNTMDRGAREVAVPNAGKDLAEAVVDGTMRATVMAGGPEGFNQDRFYSVQLDGWNETRRIIDAYTAQSGLLNPGDVIYLPVNGHSPNADNAPAGTTG